jgi:hypothetical protein
MGNLLRSDHFEFREENGSETLRWILDKLWRWELDGSGSELCPISYLVFNDAEILS